MTPADVLPSPIFSISTQPAGFQFSGLDSFADFKNIWVVDFEFGEGPDLLPKVRCMVAREILSGTLFSLWADELVKVTKPPFDIGDDSLFVVAPRF